MAPAHGVTFSTPPGRPSVPEPGFYGVLAIGIAGLYLVVKYGWNRRLRNSASLHMRFSPDAAKRKTVLKYAPFKPPASSGEHV